MKKFLLLLLLFIPHVSGQIAIYVISGPNLPANCSVKQGQVWFKNTGGAGIEGLYQCGPTDNTWTYVGASGGSLVNSVTGTTNQISCSPTTGNVVCSITNPLVIGSGPASAWFTGTGGLIGFPQGTCTGTIPSGSDWLCDSSTGLQYGPASGSFGPLSGIPVATVATLPASPSGHPTYLVTDAQSGNDCSSGGNLVPTPALCTFFSPDWQPTAWNATTNDLDQLYGIDSDGNLAITPQLTSAILGVTASPGDNTLQIATNAFVTNGLSGKAASNAATTVNGQTCTLGSTCTVGLTSANSFNGYGMWQLSVPTTSTLPTTANITNVTTVQGTNFLSLVSSANGAGAGYRYGPCGSAPWDIYVLFFVSGDWSANGFNGGVDVNDGTKVIRFTISNANNTGIYVQSCTTFTSGCSNTYTAQFNSGSTPNWVPGPYWFHIKNDATNLKWYFSQDAQAEKLMGSQTITNFLSAATSCGIDINPFNSSPASITVLSWNNIAGGGSLTAQ